ncbi:MAG: cupin domain-containing protein [Rhodopseudomonas palustris]|uniref:Cupin domain-containing protein n=1 Tax=Rhodopseudomonas palustris TaxID=1076 RepID=A0A933S4U0_RHOPL|nr:cupin domain-containing protein [Rhodopseudomonas palustris]
MSTKKAAKASGRAVAKPPVTSETQIGLRLRHQRIAKRMTLNDLARQADCSESMLSKVENGRATPSLRTVQRLCDVLGITVGQLFGRASERRTVSRAGERPILSMHPLRPANEGVQMEQLVPADPGSLLEGSIHVIAPGAKMDLVSHVGEEVAYVIEGTLEITIGAERSVVSAGDSYYFRSELPHGYRNPGPGTARVIVINTPATF